MDYRFESVALIAVTYNSVKLADFFLETARLFKYVWIIDNNSQDNTVVEFGRKIKNARIVALKENIGFGPANNIGFRLSQEFCERAIFLNPDCKIDETSIQLVLQVMCADNSIAIASPVVFSDVTFGANLKFRDYSKGFAKNNIEMKKYSLDLPEIMIEACLDGACFVVDSKKFQIIGAFDENIFMYSEEDDISMRLSRQGLKKITVRDAHAQHIGGASSEVSTQLSLRKKYHHRWSVIYMTNKYLGATRRVLISTKTLLFFPFAITIYVVAFNKNNIIKWVAWLLAAFDGLFLTKFFRKLI